MLFSLIIPVYNADAFIGGTLERLRTWLIDRPRTELIIVDDGSTDTTQSILRRATSQIPRLRIVSLPSNHGKGYALRAGLREAQGDYLAFTDADLPYGLPILDRMLSSMQSHSDVCLVYGSRSHALSKEEKGYGVVRRFGRNFFSSLISYMVVPDVRDTQCGIKMFSRALAEKAIRTAIIDRFAFDIELFMIARGSGWNYQAYPVELNHRKESSVRLVRDTLLMLRDVMRIIRRYKSGGYV